MSANVTGSVACMGEEISSCETARCGISGVPSSCRPKISGWPVDGTEGRLPPSSEITGGTSGTSSVKGDVAARLQSELVMGDIVGEIMEGPVG